MLLSTLQIEYNGCITCYTTFSREIMVNAVDSFIVRDEQLQYKRCCYLLMQAMLPGGFACLTEHTRLIDLNKKIRRV